LIKEKAKGIDIQIEIAFRHEIASILFLPLFPITQWEALTDMVIAHHRSPCFDARKQGICDLVEIEGEDRVFERHAQQWEFWSPVALEILESLGITIKEISISESREAFDFALKICKTKPLGWSKYKGLINGADYFASSINDKSLEYSSKLFTAPDLSYFDSQKRKSHVYPLSVVDATSDKPHTLVIAPTGAGKTDYLMRRCKGRVFYTLPFQASINAMYERLKKALPDETDIRLLHASSRIKIEKNNSEEKALQSKIGSSIKVLTPHQLAALVCGTRGFENIALDITNCDVIMDEIHSYSDIAQSLVIEIINSLLKLNCRVHIGSATMPTALIDIIVKLLGGNEQLETVRLPDDELDTFNRHVVFKHADESTAFGEIARYVDGGNKVLVVCNRVDVAQKRFEELKLVYPDIPMMLLHSRFRRMDRTSLEEKLQNEFNDRKKMPGACIVVSTQVVEVSLDISFDVMFTDAAPIDALIQRFGRVNRYRTEETIANPILKDIHIIAPPDDENQCKPYKKAIIDASFELFKNSETLLERNLQTMIDSIYPTITIKPIGTQLVWEGEQFLLTELCHLPESVLMEKLNVESAACIRLSDKEIYEKSTADDRIQYEIPIPRTACYRKFTCIEQLKCGNKPFVVPDILYDSTIGLQLKEIEAMI
jgi:CRISPR-associated endonuclease/helicase Cas3